MGMDLTLVSVSEFWEVNCGVEHCLSPRLAHSMRHMCMDLWQPLRGSESSPDSGTTAFRTQVQTCSLKQTGLISCFFFFFNISILCRTTLYLKYPESWDDPWSKGTICDHLGMLWTSHHFLLVFCFQTLYSPLVDTAFVSCLNRAQNWIHFLSSCCLGPRRNSGSFDNLFILEIN